MEDPRPIIILGSARCGTTSLANHLCEHPSIAGVQAEEHWGIKECPFLCNWRNSFGDISTPEQFLPFFEQFSQADYFRASGLEKELFYKNPPGSWEKFIRMLMETYAKRKNADYWLMKAPRQTMYVQELSEMFPETRFVSIRRNLKDMVQSNIKKAGNKPGVMNIAKRVFRYQTDFRAVDLYKNQLDHFLEIQFDRFTKKPRDVLKNITNFLELPWKEEMVENPYRVESSFRNDTSERQQFLSSMNRLTIQIWNCVLRLIPFSIMYYIRKKWDQSRAEDPDQQRLYFRLHPESDRYSGKRFHREDKVNHDVETDD